MIITLIKKKKEKNKEKRNNILLKTFPNTSKLMKYFEKLTNVMSININTS